MDDIVKAHGGEIKVEIKRKLYKVHHYFTSLKTNSYYENFSGR